MNSLYQLAPATSGSRLRATPVDRRVLFQSKIEAETFLRTLRRRAFLGSTLKCFAGMALVTQTIAGVPSKLISGARVYGGRHVGLFEEDAQVYLFSVDAAGDVVFPASFRFVAVSVADGVELVAAAQRFA